MKFGEDGRLYAVNPEAGFFGVAPGHEPRRRIRTRWRRVERNSIFTNCARTDDGDVWWEGMTDEPPDARDRLARQRLDARAPRSPAAHPNARFTTPAAQCPCDRSGVGGPRRRADRRLPVRRPPGHGGAAGHRGVRLGARRVPRRDDVGRRPPRRPRARSASSASTRSRCCRSAATTWPTTSATGWSSDARSGVQAAEGVPRQLVPQGRRRQASSGPATARTAACWSGSPAAATARARRSRPRSGWFRRPGRARHRGPRAVRRGRWSELLAVDAGDLLRSSSRRSRSTWPASATASRSALSEQLEALEAPAAGLSAQFELAWSS